MKATLSSETSVLTRATRLNNLQEGILHMNLNLKEKVLSTFYENIIIGKDFSRCRVNNYGAFGLCPSSGFLEIENTHHPNLDLFPS
jgi:hypothetical protein